MNGDSPVCTKQSLNSCVHSRLFVTLTDLDSRSVLLDPLLAEILEELLHRRDANSRVLGYVGSSELGSTSHPPRSPTQDEPCPLHSFALSDRTELPRVEDAQSTEFC